MTEITNGTTTLHPILWMGYVSSRDARTKTHDLVSGDTAITLAPAGPRRVTVVLLFTDEDESKACEDMHARPGILTITEDGRTTHSMQYVVIGKVARELDPDSAAVWFVSAEVQEVGAP